MLKQLCYSAYVPRAPFHSVGTLQHLSHMLATSGASFMFGFCTHRKPTKKPLKPVVTAPPSQANVADPKLKAATALKGGLRDPPAAYCPAAVALAAGLAVKSQHFCFRPCTLHMPPADLHSAPSEEILSSSEPDSGIICFLQPPARASPPAA